MEGRNSFEFCFDVNFFNHSVFAMFIIVNHKNINKNNNKKNNKNSSNNKDEKEGYKTVPPLDISIREEKKEKLHYQMHRHHEVVLVGTSVGLPPSLQKPLGIGAYRCTSRLLSSSVCNSCQKTDLARFSSNLRARCIWNMRSPPLTYSMTKNRRSCTIGWHIGLIRHSTGSCRLTITRTGAGHNSFGKSQK